MSHTPFTQEQVEWLETSRRRSIKMAVRNFRNAALAGYLILLLGIGVTISQTRHESAVRRQQGTAQRQAIVRSGRAVSVAGCNRDFQTIVALRKVLTDARGFERLQHSKGLIPDDEFRHSETFYATQLVRLKVPDCRKAASVITSNPEKRTVAPQPLHP